MNFEQDGDFLSFKGEIVMKFTHNLLSLSALLLICTSSMALKVANLTPWTLDLNFAKGVTLFSKEKGGIATKTMKPGECYDIEVQDANQCSWENKEETNKFYGKALADIGEKGDQEFESWRGGCTIHTSDHNLIFYQNPNDAPRVETYGY